MTRRVFSLYALGLLLTYFGLVIGGITMSHNSAVFGAEGEVATVLMGKPRPERSDEYLRGSPRLVATLNRIALDAYTPLDVTGSDAYREVGRQPLAQVLAYTRPPHMVIVDQVSRLLPLRMGFALHWWLSAATLLLLLPIWFRQIGLQRRYGVLCAVSLLFCSVNMWFSGLPVFLAANSVLAAVCVLTALQVCSRQNTPWLRAAVVVSLAIYAGRSAFTVVEYPPWGLPILTVVAISSLVALPPYWGSTRGKLTLGAVGLFLFGAALLNYFHNRSIYEVVLNTVYPGQRRASGGNVDTPVWGGVLSWMMQGERARSNGLTNPEMALGPTFLVIPLAIALARQTLRGSRKLIPAIAGTFTTLVLVLWASIQWPPLLRNFNPLVLIPAIRSSQIAGVLALLTLYLFLGGLGEDVSRPKLRLSALVAVVALVVVATDVEQMRGTYLQNADITFAWLSLVVVALVAIAINSSWRPQLIGGVVMVLCISSSFLVNPLTVGLGPLENSSARSAILNLSKESPTLRWATTGFFQDALMISTGVPQLSGQQPLGPNLEAWRKLDPSESSKDAWNRGQSYVNFQWDGRPGITIWNPSPDVIQVVVNPCRPELDDLDLGWVVTAADISFDCLEKETTVTWMGAPLNIYRRSVTAIFED